MTLQGQRGDDDVPVASAEREPVPVPAAPGGLRGVPAPGLQLQVQPGLDREERGVLGHIAACLHTHHI